MIESTSGRFDRTDHALVIGLGRSGRASVDVLRTRLGSVVATDEAPPEKITDALEELRAANVRFIPPDELNAALEHVTVAVLSPGIPLNNPLVRRVQAAGIPVFSEVEVAYRLCKAPIVAVTGTKGKTTTTALVGALFAAAGKTVHVGGNIGNALIRETANAAADDWVVAEVSSFQLESIRSFKPKRLADPQRHARPPRPLPLDGRVRGSEVPHLHKPRAGRHVRGQPRRSDRRVRVGRPERRPRARAHDVVLERAAPPVDAVPAQPRADRLRAADRRPASRSTSCA